MKLACIAYRLPNDIDEFYTTGPLSHKLYETLENMMIDYKAEDIEIVTGLNIGPDMILPWIGEEYNLPVIAVLPYISYGGKAMEWTEYDQNQYIKMLKYENLTINWSSSGHSKPWKEHHKNKRIIEISDIIVFFGENEFIKSAKEFAKHLNKETFTVNIPKNESVL